MTDAIWETERLASLINDPDDRVGSLVFCFDDQNQRSIANLVRINSPYLYRTYEYAGSLSAHASARARSVPRSR